MADGGVCYLLQSRTLGQTDDGTGTNMSQNLEFASPVTEVAEAVRDFYERYPYPRPVDNLDQYRRQWDDPAKRRADHHLFWPETPYKDDQSILVAGCGTSQAAKHALRWPSAHVTGVDISATSVHCTEDLKRKYSLNNLEVYQLPIDRLKELEKTFDQIVCTGVLHHLPDPDAGLAALREVLKPDGAMHLMVYAPHGRAGIYMLQEFCRRLGIVASEEAIEGLIIALQALPPGHPLEHLLGEAPDFGHHAALADALLHPQDRAYSVPQLFDFIKSGQLTFGRWMKQAPYLPHCGVMVKIPQSSLMAKLPLEEQYAAVELFRGTMTRHSVIVYRNDRPGSMVHMSLGGDEWPGYIPIRMPDTILVRDRLPPGAEAVLINRTHTYRDIVMTLNSTETRLFEAVDGTRTIGDILEKALPPSQQLSRESARAFFERLWWHDQVVFDASQPKVTQKVQSKKRV
jgi:SAM-dependent methyltransferase